MDVIEKLKILIRVVLPNAFREWREGVWREDLGRPYCCDGRECGCGGITIRELYHPERQL